MGTAVGITHCVNPGQTGPSGAGWSGLTLFGWAFPSNWPSQIETNKNLENLKLRTFTLSLDASKHVFWVLGQVALNLACSDTETSKNVENVHVVVRAIIFSKSE